MHWTRASLVAYVVALHLVLGAVLLRKLWRGRQASVAHDKHYRQLLASHRRMDGLVLEGAVIFIGDSRIAGLCVSAVCDNGVNFGIGSDTTVGVLNRLEAYASLNRARAVVLAIGYNDLRERDNDAIIENCRKMIAKMPRETSVLLCAVSPIDERICDERWNSRIAELNPSYERLCSSTANWTFVGSPAQLVDEAGNLRADCHEGDGIHLSDTGYRIWVEALQRELPKGPAVSVLRPQNPACQPRPNSVDVAQWGQ